MKQLWKKALFIVADILLLSYIVLAMTSFNKPLIEKNALCSRVEINLEKTEMEGFLTPKEIKNILLSNELYPLKKPIRNIDTRRIEQTLLCNQLIESVVCYKTCDGGVIMNLCQRIPVLRVKSDNGDDYYLDSDGEMLSGVLYPADLIVATGHISKNYARKRLKNVATFIVGDSFWRDEIEQINVLADGSVELVPRLGRHIVRLGQPDDVEEKMLRLYKFYKYGLSVIGWNKYSSINVEFSNQIICKY